MHFERWRRIKINNNTTLNFDILHKITGTQVHKVKHEDYFGSKNNLYVTKVIADGSKSYCRWSKLKVGDYVRVKTPKVMRKGDKKFTEPVKIVKQKGPGTFQTQDHKTWNQKQLTFYPVVENLENEDVQVRHDLQTNENGS